MKKKHKHYLFLTKKTLRTDTRLFSNWTLRQQNKTKQVFLKSTYSNFLANEDTSSDDFCSDDSCVKERVKKRDERLMARYKELENSFEGLEKCYIVPEFVSLQKSLIKFKIDKITLLLFWTYN